MLIRQTVLVMSCDGTLMEVLPGQPGLGQMMRIIEQKDSVSLNDYRISPV